jgi:G:T-mismatch repair DNA endonuclease (very short patch repair protein)
VRDLRRKRRLRTLGWEIVDVWWSDLNRTAEVLADVRLAITVARARNLAADRAIRE